MESNIGKRRVTTGESTPSVVIPDRLALEPQQTGKSFPNSVVSVAMYAPLCSGKLAKCRQSGVTVPY